MCQNSLINNKVLAALPLSDYERLLPHLEQVHLPLKSVLGESNQPFQYAYFPLTTVVSLFSVMEAGQHVETATVGNEGMIGLPLVLGTLQIPMQAVTQIAGEALRIPAAILQAELRQGGFLHSLLLRYTQTLMSQIAQTVACTRLHTEEERCCFLLALMQDRTGSEELPLTQEALASLVGVRRADVKAIATTLERAGFIYYQRGKIRILDRSGLEAAACDCYHTLKAEFDRLLSGSPN